MNYEFVYQVQHDRSYLNVPNSRFDLPDANPSFNQDIYPAPIPFHTSPVSGDAIIRFEQNGGAAWFNYIGEKLIKDTEGNKVWRKNNGGLFNANQNTIETGGYFSYPMVISEKPHGECLTSCGNWVEGTEVVNGSLKILRESLTDSPKYNYHQNPTRVQKFTSIDKRDGKLGLVGDDVYWPYVSNDDLYLKIKEPAGPRLVQIPQLPLEVTIMNMKGLTVREYPTIYANTTGSLAKGTKVTVIDYHLWASDTWGKLSTGGWICLRMVYRSTEIFYTTWTMPTVAPLSERNKIFEPLSFFTSEPPAEPPVEPPIEPPIEPPTVDEIAIWNDAMDAGIAALEAAKK